MVPPGTYELNDFIHSSDGGDINSLRPSDAYMSVN